MPQLHQMAHQLPGAAVIVETDAGMFVVGVVLIAVHIGDAAPLQQRIDARIMLLADQLHPVHATFDQRPHGFDLLARIILRGGDQQLVAIFLQPLLQPLDTAGEDADADGRHHRSDGVGAPRGQRPGGAVAHIAQLLHRQCYLLADAGTHLIRVVQHAGNGGSRNACTFRNIAKLGHAIRKRFPCLKHCHQSIARDWTRRLFCALR